jgi:hypothetical protein
MAVGHSDEIDPLSAVNRAIDQCRVDMNGASEPQAGLLFIAADAFDPGLIEAVRKAFPAADILGATSSAEISSGSGYMEDSISLAVFGSDTVEFGSGLGSGLGSDVAAACQAAVDQALRSMTTEPRACIVLHEAFVADPPQVVDALTGLLPEGIPILGGTSARSDFATTTPTYQFRNEDVATDGIAIMLFGGNIDVSTAVGLGFRTIGPTGKVTAADESSIQQIDGRPATEFLHRYMEATGPAAFANPLAVLEDDAEEFYLRVIVPSDPGSGVVMTAGSVPVGARVQLTTADTDEVLAGTRDALERALAAFPGKGGPDAAVIFSCAVRKFLLGSRTHIEAELARSVLGDVPTIGLYCYGEVGPLRGASTSRFLNETFVSLLLGG